VLITSWLFKGFQPRRAEGVFKTLHLFSSAAYSISHGGNDAQKTMGIITVLLYSTGYLQGEFHVPEWVVIACYLAISLGTMSGGWKIIKTMGTKLTKLNHHTGFSDFNHARHNGVGDRHWRCTQGQRGALGRGNAGGDGLVHHDPGQRGRWRAVLYPDPDVLT
jgi:Phosphate transporter family